MFFTGTKFAGHSNYRHLQFTKECQNVATRFTSEDAIFVLDADEVVAIEVKKPGRAFLRRVILLIKLYPDLFGILIA